MGGGGEVDEVEVDEVDEIVLLEVNRFLEGHES